MAGNLAPLPLPAYPELEKALGYPVVIQSTWVTFYYVPGCSMIDDGYVTLSGFDYNYLAFEHLFRGYFPLGDCRFGSDDDYGTHRFLLNRPSRNLYVVSEEDAIKILQQQWHGKPKPFEEILKDVIEREGEARGKQLFGEAFTRLMARPFDFLGSNQELAKFRTEMLNWYSVLASGKTDARGN